eukprot:m.93331 g.93331  ORF g.93331 m.93331 type:complete len:513 (-) comp21775_c0_seq2:121-1659(-)
MLRLHFRLPTASCCSLLHRPPPTRGKPPSWAGLSHYFSNDQDEQQQQQPTYPSRQPQPQSQQGTRQSSGHKLSEPCSWVCSTSQLDDHRSIKVDQDAQNPQCLPNYHLGQPKRRRRRLRSQLDRYLHRTVHASTTDLAKSHAPFPRLKTIKTREQLKLDRQGRRASRDRSKDDSDSDSDPDSDSDSDSDSDPDPKLDFDSLTNHSAGKLRPRTNHHRHHSHYDEPSTARLVFHPVLSHDLKENLVLQQYGTRHDQHTDPQNPAATSGYWRYLVPEAYKPHYPTSATPSSSSSSSSFSSSSSSTDDHVGNEAEDDLDFEKQFQDDPGAPDSLQKLEAEDGEYYRLVETIAQKELEPITSLESLQTSANVYFTSDEPPPLTRAPGHKPPYELAEILLKNFGENLVVLELDADARHFYDFVLICTGNSPRHLQRLATAVVDEFKNVHIQELDGPPQITGLKDPFWTIVYTGNCVVHLFVEEARNYYKLETLWAPKASGIAEDLSKLYNQDDEEGV